MYIIHLVLMCLIGLVTLMSVNTQLVSEGNDGCFLLRCCCPPTPPTHTPPPFLGNPPVSCPTCLQGATSTQRLQVFKGHLRSKALDLLFNSLVFPCYFWRCPLIWIPKEVTHTPHPTPSHSVAMEIDEHRLGTPALIQWFFLFLFLIIIHLFIC